MADMESLEATENFAGDRGTPEAGAQPALPERIGRYRVERVLGKGGFGLVYLAQDEQLSRRVAMKVPHSRLISRLEDAELYLAEARTVANLDHPHIVPVYDVGGTPEFPCYVVSKYIEGIDLANRLKTTHLDSTHAAELIATIAEALHYAHKQGLVHRDVKPGNILIGSDGRPYLVDFGLALREQDFGRGANFAGTSAYMSPEQARGEGHRVDGRSDIFSLGIIFYELLVARRPFAAPSQSELLDQITTLEVRPPRQIDDTVPKELERICLKALSKRAADRYTTAKDLAEDLRHFLLQLPRGDSTIAPVAQARQSEISDSEPASETNVPGDTPPVTSSSDSRPIRIVPKGLRSFDRHDADFFLELLPGPRDRDGLPDSLRFWKTRIEETDVEKTFSVGLICGPSGCGKSSLVKAGLLPRLAENVIPVYVEATADETETRLLNGLRKACPGLVGNLDLPATLAALRRGQGLSPGKKVLIVLDQFEQWLHAKREEEDTDLVQALRQCDGGRVQGIVMVRDDFWMAVIRFMRELEIRLLEGQNSAAVDLFPIRHAEKVLAAFGRAFGALPEGSSDASEDQQEFLNQAVSGLAQEGKVICVRLALFSEMMKGKSWTPTTLKEVGGTQGVGVTFLEETFSAATAPPEHRYHQKAARAVLKTLLPESGTDIKGHMRSYQELLAASGYGSRRDDFDDLVRILDTEIRLITPTDPEGKESEREGVSTLNSLDRYYQLTHDYLVPSLRDWLTRKQRETRRGRAELRLAEWSATWNAKPERRYLPSPWEYLSIVGLTPRKNWTSPQRKMMRAAGMLHGIRSGVVAALLLVCAVVGVGIRNSVIERQQADRAAGLVDTLVNAEIVQVPPVIRDLHEYRRWANPLLRSEFAEAIAGSRERLHLALALLPVDETQAAYLLDQLPVVSPSQFPIVRDSILSQGEPSVEPLWKVALDETRSVQPRFQAACALATYAPGDERWGKVDKLVAGHLVTRQASDLVVWRDALRPAKNRILKSLGDIYRDTTQERQYRVFATETLADYAAEQPDVLVDLLADAEQFQYRIVFEKLNGAKAVPLAAAELTKQPAKDASEDDREQLAKRQANTAVALVKLNAAEQAWPLLKHTPDPRARTYFIHWLKPLGGTPQALIPRLRAEPDVSIRRAMILTLGEFDESQLPATERQPLIEKLLAIYESDPDASLHAASEWLLRRWGEGPKLGAVVDKLRADVNQRSGPKAGEQRNWYVNSQGQTMVILERGEFTMGSPTTEPNHLDIEIPHRRVIGRRFAIAAHEVTKAQFAAFQAERSEIAKMNSAQYVKTDDSPQVAMTWYEAAAYCNWLSQKEGLTEDQWCYEPNAEKQYASGMKAKPQAGELLGYRLPSEGEWEYACRAGSVTSRYYGLSESLLAEYAWTLDNGKNRTWPVGSLKPNDWGLFDMLGNAIEWTQEPYSDYPRGAVQDVLDESPVSDNKSRVLRGGSFYNVARYARSAYRFTNQPTYRNYFSGFRAARTYPLAP